MGAATTEPRRIGSAAGRLDREAARARASQLFVEHGELVRRVCVGLLRDRYDAEDAAQQTFLSAYRALAEGTDPREPAAWLATIARNECLLRIRARMRAPVATPLEDEAAPDDVHREAVSRSHAAKLWREIRSLPQQQRDVVILREFAGLSYDELAVALGISKPAVESLLFRARGRLRTRLEAAFASLNLAGAASTIADAAARLVGSGAAQPAAAKIVAAGAAAALVGGGTAVVTDHVVPSGHHAATRRAPAQLASRLPAAPRPSAPVFAIAAQPRHDALLAAANPHREHAREDGAARGGDGREQGDGESRPGAGPAERRSGDTRDDGGERVTTGGRSTDGGGEGDGRPATATSVRVDSGGESGDGRDGGHDGGDVARTTTSGEAAPTPTTTSSTTTSEDSPPPPTTTSSDGGSTTTIPLTTTGATVPLPTAMTDGGGDGGSGSGSDG